MDPIRIIDKYYPEGDLRTLLLSHSSAVARKALELTDRNARMDIDRAFVYEAAMLHDIGIFLCHAPSIYCIGELPYIRHGIEGARILKNEGLELHALVCERHTGAGLTIDDIVSQNLPLPHRMMLPVTPEERLICYADKFFSKSADSPTIEKPMERIVKSMEKFGPATLARFEALRAEFN